MKWKPHHCNKHLYLTCATTSNIYLWDLEDPKTVGKSVRKFESHTNRSSLTWSHFNPEIFFSGSTDSKIFMWDMRKDKRLDDFSSYKQKVKHIVSDPKNGNQFAAGYSDGTVHVWDIRNPLKSVQNYSLHTTKEITYLDWHPTQEGILLSGG